MSANESSAIFHDNEKSKTTEGNIPIALNPDDSADVKLATKSTVSDNIQSFNNRVMKNLQDIIASGDPTHLYTFTDLIGVGGTASVYRALTQDEQNVAVKKIAMDMSPGSLLKKRLYSELHIMKECNHHNVVSYYNSYLLSDEVWLVMEFINGVSVEHLVMEPPFRIATEDITALVTRETLQGIQYIHHKGFIHRDIKSGNILVSQQGGVKITDFGLSTSQDSYQKKAKMGTVSYMAPEVAIGDPDYNQAADIWSLGITVYEMFKGIPPMFNIDADEALEALRKKEKPPIPGVFFVSVDLEDIMHRCLEVDYVERPSAVDLLTHPFLQCACSFEKLGAFVKRAMLSRCTRE